MKQRLFFILGFFCLFLFPSVYANDPDGNTYTTPERMFYITRSVNKNLVCYDYNLKEGKLDTEKPLHVYWVNREEHPGKKDELNYIQRKMAYGYKLVRQGDGQSVVTLTAYSGRELTIRPYKGRYACFIQIQNQEAILQSLYVQIKPSNPMSVEYVELRGVSVQSGQPLSEQIRK
ncbi:MAG: DUF4833 domain-containing protein [Parabacteroides sp.]